MSSLRTRTAGSRRGALLRSGGALLLSLFCCACASGPADLEIVPAPIPEEPALLPRFDLELTATAEGSMWLPLPASDEGQTIESLLWLVPAGDHELAEVGGQRALRASSGTKIELRVRFALPGKPAPPLSENLTERLATLSKTEGVFVKQALAAGIKARLSHGVAWSQGGGAQMTQWVELEVQGAWFPYRPREGALVSRAGLLRLGGESPRGVGDLAVRVESGG
ncbi:MAG: hypothetical protein JKY65_09910 [Planctomycetes bacterium]|nr:hypothetical protein [Planctomycetota bacterium]